ncbi:MAG: anti-sigma factor [Pontixanthobacter sp.]
MSADELTERERLAAEHALRLLEGDELLQARGLMANDPAFARAVAEWEQRLSPLHDTLADVAPDPELWSRIETMLAGEQPAAEIVTLQRRVRQWQFASLASAAAAIALAFFAVPGLQSPADKPENDAPLMANIPIADTPLRIAVTYLPDKSEMLVSASGLSADGVHDHELWLVVPGGAAQSLGVVVPGKERRVALDKALAARIHAGSQMLLTREPLGGAPKDASAGPVVAEGEFLKS